MLVKRSEWAKRRGVSKPYVTKLIQNGKVILENGLVNEEQAEASLAATTNHTVQRNAVQRDSSHESMTAKLSTALLKTRLKNEAEKGKILEIEAKIKSGQYVDAQEVENQAFYTARTVRDSLQNIPSRISSLLASISDANQIYEVLSKEIRLALVDLAEKLGDK
jgi:phage terminase Nu1 subunit (DNA packaging protein)